jgi:hypothetical protein
LNTAFTASYSELTYCTSSAAVIPVRFASDVISFSFFAGIRIRLIPDRLAANTFHTTFTHNM